MPSFPDGTSPIIPADRQGRLAKYEILAAPAEQRLRGGVASGSVKGGRVARHGCLEMPARRLDDIAIRSTLSR